MQEGRCGGGRETGNQFGVALETESKFSGYLIPLALYAGKWLLPGMMSAGYVQTSHLWPFQRPRKNTIDGDKHHEPKVDSKPPLTSLLFFFSFTPVLFKLSPNFFFS